MKGIHILKVLNVIVIIFFSLLLLALAIAAAVSGIFAVLASAYAIAHMDISMAYKAAMLFAAMLLSVYFGKATLDMLKDWFALKREWNF